MFVRVGFESLPSFDCSPDLDRGHPTLFYDAMRNDSDIPPMKEIQKSVVCAGMSCPKFVDGIAQVFGLRMPQLLAQLLEA